MIRAAQAGQFKVCVKLAELGADANVPDSVSGHATRSKRWRRSLFIPIAAAERRLLLLACLILTCLLLAVTVTCWHVISLT